MALFDSDILVDILRGVPGSGESVESFDEEKNHISAITLGEVLFGMRENEKYNTLSLLSGFSVIHVDTEIVFQAAEIKTRAKGHNLVLYDCIIAATAIKHSQTLVTRNARHYPDKSIKLFIPEYK